MSSYDEYHRPVGYRRYHHSSSLSSSSSSDTIHNHNNPQPPATETETSRGIPSAPPSSNNSNVDTVDTSILDTIDPGFSSSWSSIWDSSYSSSTTAGSAVATLAVLSFLSYEEVERYCRYTGPHGIRHLIFPNTTRSTATTTSAAAGDNNNNNNNSSSATSVLSSLRDYSSNLANRLSSTIHHPHTNNSRTTNRNMAPNPNPSAAAAVPISLTHAHSVMSTQSSSASVGSGPSEHSDGSHPDQHHSKGHRHRSRSSHHHQKHHGDLPPPVLVYHESARSIVFRDHLRRAAEAEDKQQRSKESSSSSSSKKGGDDNDGDDGGSNSIYHNQHVSSEREKEISQDLASEWNEMSNLFGGGAGAGSGVSSSEGGAGVGQSQQNLTAPLSVEIEGFQPNIVPLPHLQLGPNDEFGRLWVSDLEHTGDQWTTAEKEVVQMLENQRAVVKTIKNTEWTSFLHRFKTAYPPRGRYPNDHNDSAPPENDEDFPFNSFVTSTTLLPAGGHKMRCFGNPNNYTTGVIFALPQYPTSEEETAAVENTRTWSWPSGYSAKTEFNIDSRGELINGRQEALVSLKTLREYNHDYLTKTEYMIAGRLLKGGLNTVPYNEVFVRVGGPGRLVNGKDCATGKPRNDLDQTGRSLDKGVGLPVALFVRTATFGHLISLLRTRARLSHVLGEQHFHGIPLLYMTPDKGIRVLTEKLQKDLLKIAAKNLNPFQNPMIAHKTTIDDTDQSYLETKVEELIDLDESIRQTLTPEECVRLAGGFGATDDSIAQILKDAMFQDKLDNTNNLSKEKSGEEAHRLQDIVNEGLASAVRSGDYYTSRQLLILYSLVASEGHQLEVEAAVVDGINNDEENKGRLMIRKKSLDSEAMLLKRQAGQGGVVTNRNSSLPPPPPPPPLDTDRLRSATNSDGLLAVLGAAQVLKAMQDGSAKKRTEESFLAVEEWVEYGEQSMAFRLASWRDQRAAQDDLQIATDNNSSFMAFVSKKAITNRSTFAKQLREATLQTDFSDIRFLRAIYEMVQRMHSPCLRLELLQYVLGLDNRYSIAHVKRSIELAATCLSITAITEETKASSD